MNFEKVIGFIEDGVKFIESIAPIATQIGGPIVGNITATILTVTDIAHNLLERADEAGHVFNEDDQTAINDLINRLTAQNDKLAEAIRNS
jgi:hypothetical protein